MATVPIDLIVPRSNQPRRSMDDERLRDLTDSVREYGVLQPIRLRRFGSRYEVIAGHRRLAAARRAGLTELPAVVVNADDRRVLIESLIENIQREDLNPDDRGEALRRLRVSLGAGSWNEVGRMIGISRRHIYHLLNIGQLPEPIREDVRAGVVTEKHARALLRLHKHPQLQMALWQRITKEQMIGDEALRTSKELLAGASPDDCPPERRAARETPIPTLERAVADLGWLLPRATMKEVRPLREQLEALAQRLGDVIADAFHAAEETAAGARPGPTHASIEKLYAAAAGRRSGWLDSAERVERTA